MPRRVGPGPGAYILPPTVGFENHDLRKDRKPAYSFGARVPTKMKTFGPGPGAYNLSNRVNRFGPDGTPAFSLGPRLPGLKIERTPGPGAHENHLSPIMKGRRPPAFSIYGRLNTLTKQKTPAPNAYVYSVDYTKPTKPAFSIAPRLHTKIVSQSPGPAAYGEPKTNFTHKSSPSFSLKGRTPLLTTRDKKPAPNAYNLQSLKLDTGPSYSFGMRVENAIPYIVPADNC